VVNSADDAAHDAEQRQQQLAAAFRAAGAISDELTQEWRSKDLSPAVSVKLDVGEDNDPVFVFSILLRLDEDFDASQFPGELVEQLKSDLRSRVVASEVDLWNWLVTAAAVTSGTANA
jgi:hypothetical protein